jgi:hypothetical protein
MVLHGIVCAYLLIMRSWLLILLVYIHMHVSNSFCVIFIGNVCLEEILEMCVLHLFSTGCYSWILIMENGAPIVSIYLQHELPKSRMLTFREFNVDILTHHNTRAEHTQRQSVPLRGYTLQYPLMCSVLFRETYTVSLLYR